MDAGENVKKAEERILRALWESTARARIAKSLRISPKKVVVDIAPLSKVIPGKNFRKDTRAYYTAFDKNDYIKEMGVLSLYTLTNCKKAKFIKIPEEADIAFKNVAMDRQYFSGGLRERTLDEMLAMETKGATVEDLKKAITKMYGCSKVEITDYDKFPWDVVEKGIFRVKYRITLPDRITVNWIPVNGLGIDKYSRRKK